MLMPIHLSVEMERFQLWLYCIRSRLRKLPIEPFFEDGIKFNHRVVPSVPAGLYPFCHTIAEAVKRNDLSALFDRHIKLPFLALTATVRRFAQFRENSNLTWPTVVNGVNRPSAIGSRGVAQITPAWCRRIVSLTSAAVRAASSLL